MDGPLIKAAKKAFIKKQINVILVWLPEEYEDEVRKAFDKAQNVRKFGQEASELAEIYFFETVVRLYCMGEGEPYTGIKPAGLGSSLLLSTADKSLEDGSLKELFKILTHMIRERVRDRFINVMVKKSFNQNNIDAARAYVKAYVKYVECVNKIYEALKNPTEYISSDYDSAYLQR